MIKNMAMKKLEDQINKKYNSFICPQCNELESMTNEEIDNEIKYFDSILSDEEKREKIKFLQSLLNEC
jgi:hypothetical protein